MIEQEDSFFTHIDILLKPGNKLLLKLRGREKESGVYTMHWGLGGNDGDSGVC